MATGTHTVEVPVGIEDVWISLVIWKNGQKLVPGYNAHEMIDENTHLDF